MEENKNYLVKVEEKAGTCDTELFETIAKNGDITAVKVTELLSSQVKITGYAKCSIQTAEKTFDMCYYDTEEYGLISSGSEIFFKSVKTYFGKVENVRLTEIKTKKGKTYKAVPVLGNSVEEKKEETKKEETTNNNELPF